MNRKVCNNDSLSAGQRACLPAGFLLGVVLLFNFVLLEQPARTDRSHELQ